MKQPAISVASSLLLLLGATHLAAASEAHPESDDTHEEQSRDSTRVGVRFGMLSSGSGSGVRLFAPSAGLDVSEPFAGRVGRFLGFSALYAFAYSTRGTSEVGVSRFGNLGAAFLELRAPITSSATVRLGLGPSVHAVTASTYAGAGSVSSTVVDAGVAWQTVLDVAVPKSRFGLAIGALVLARTRSLDAGAHVSLTFAL